MTKRKPRTATTRPEQATATKNPENTTAACEQPPVKTPAASRPMSVRTVARMSRSARELADLIEAVGLRESVISKVDGLRMDVNHFLSVRDYDKDDITAWDKELRDWMMSVMDPLGWFHPSAAGKHTTAEIVEKFRLLAKQGEKYASGSQGGGLDVQGGPALPWTPDEVRELLENMRTLALVVDAEPKGADTRSLAGRIRWTLADAIGHMRSETEIVGTNHTWNRKKDADELPTPELRLMALVTAAHGLTDGIVCMRAPSDCAGQLRALADAMGKAFEDLRERGILDGGGTPGQTRDATSQTESGDEEGSRPMTKSAIADGAKPLTTRAKIIKDKLLSLEDDDAMTLPQIQEWYETQANLPKDTPKTLDEGTWKRVRKELLPYGLENARGNRGYYFRK